MYFAVLVSDELSLSSGSNSSHGTPSPPTYPSFSSSNPGTSSTSTMLPETYSRKVFVGGLPPDIDQGIQILLPQHFLIVSINFDADRSLFTPLAHQLIDVLIWGYIYISFSVAF